MNVKSAIYWRRIERLLLFVSSLPRSRQRDKANGLQEAQRLLGMQTVSDAASEWLVSNKVIKREQRYDPPLHKYQRKRSLILGANLITNLNSVGHCNLCRSRSGRGNYATQKRANARPYVRRFRIVNRAGSLSRP
jgi:hypothetical protein